MHGLILAAGDGSRLAADGVAAPKAFVPIAGAPQLARLAGTMRELGCATVTVVLREDLVPEFEALRRGATPWPAVACVPARTPSSLHTLRLGFDAAPPGAIFCSMVDSVMAAEDWGRLYASCRRSLERGAAAAIAVTPFTSGGGALHADIDPSGRVRALGEERATAGRVTGGVYAFAPPTRPLAARAVEGGVVRMRGFLAWLIAQGRVVEAVDVPRIVDVDRATDVAIAEEALRAASARPVAAVLAPPREAE